MMWLLAILLAAGAIFVNTVWRMDKGELLSVFEIAVSNVCFVICITIIAILTVRMF